MIWFFLYSIIASGFVFGLVYWAEKADCWDYIDDFPWPVICGILWPVFGLVAAAYIAARWYLDNT